MKRDGYPESVLEQGYHILQMPVLAVVAMSLREMASISGRILLNTGEISTT